MSTLAPSPSLPRSPAAWLIWTWGLLGVCLILLNPVLRLGVVAVDTVIEGLSPTQWALTVVWVAFMLYSEAYRGFHKQFAPRVVVRALALAEAPRPHLVLFAPFMCMGLIHANRKRLIVSWTLVLMITAMVVAVRQLPAPWRGMVDLGVVIGLASGIGSVLWFASRAVSGHPPQVPPDLPA